MKKYMNHKMKLAIALSISTLFIVTTISSAGLLELKSNVQIGTTTPSAEPEVQESTALNDSTISSPEPLGPLGQDNDWNYWTNTTYMFSLFSKVGIGASSPVAKFQVGNGAVLFNGTTGSTPVSGAGTRLMWIPSKAAFRAGYVDGTQWDNSNVGLFSVAMGYNSKTSGYASTAMGAGTIASGNRSTAMGADTTASGQYSTVMGADTTASGAASTSMGRYTRASGDYATAMGYSTTASGQFSTAMGAWTTAFGKYSTAMGRYSNASGGASTAMGNYATASGDTSTAIGTYTTASGDYATAMGRYTIASSSEATAMGSRTNASGNYATSMGRETNAKGVASTAMGYNTIAFAQYSTAIGRYTNASGSESTAMGSWTNASKSYATSMGRETTASGVASTSMGRFTTASGDYSTAMGFGTTANGRTSTAMGAGTRASGNYSTAMGSGTIASGIYATAMGTGTTASKWISTAMGRFTTASGNYSTAMGSYTTAGGTASTAMGQTITVNGKSSFGIGLNSHTPNWFVNNSNVMSIMGGNVGIGTVSPTSTLQVVGDVNTSGNYKYSSAKTYYLNIPAAAFTPILPDYTISNQGYFFYSMYDSDLQATCSINLPDGATVTEFRVFAYDNTNANHMDVTARLIRRGIYDVNTYDLAQVIFTPSGGSDTIQSAYDNTILVATIYNKNYQYMIRISIGLSCDGSDLLRIYGCRITYTMTTIAP